MEGGIALLTEKPIAADAETAQALAAAAATRALPAMVDFTFQEVDAFRRLKDWIDSGRLGAVRAVNIHWLTHSFAHRRGLWSWKVDQAGGGGVMTAQGSHVFHLLRWLFGPVTLDFARLDRRATAPLAPPGAMPAADGAVLCLRLDNGSPVLAHLSNASPGGGKHRWDVVFDGGTLCVANQGHGIMGGFSVTLRDAEGREVVDLPAPDAGGADDRLEPFRRLAGRFIAAVRSGGQPGRALPMVPPCNP